MSGNLHNWLNLILTPGLGAATIRKLLSYFGSPQQILAASKADLLRCKMLHDETIDSLHNKRTAMETQRQIDQAARQAVTILTWDDPAYPTLLREIHNPPLVIFVKGDPAIIENPGIAVIGARAASTYGLQIAQSLSQELAGQGLTIISGMALGVDSAAHRGALNANGKTIAILGCGLDITYPKQNRGLYGQIAAHGALISEYPFGTPPDGFRFPARNRIISGLALGVVVVEAARHSGTLITAQLALDQGREVFAVPGRIDSVKSEGCHRLAQEGAKLVHSAKDIIDEIKLSIREQSPSIPPVQAPVLEDLSREAQSILDFLDVYPKNIEEIIMATGFPANKINEELFMLEMQGAVVSLPGKQYQRLAEPCKSSV
ncbi:MAG: DNA-processing protein DprA [Desulfobulbaceae bacterium]|nr:DNA-processing protein DprA [Desulfobulbaceae bacterium]HIJ79725.1 DNA-protecting protein DprA [Deltaproteobacteria bacterium]